MRAIILVFLVFLFGFTAPLQTSAQEATGTISADTAAGFDSDIRERLQDILREIGGFEDVTVSVNEGVVTLEGTATSLSDIAELDQLATRIEGVVAVKNNVTETSDITRRLNPAVERFQARIDQVIIMLPLLAIALAAFALIVALGFLLARGKQPWSSLAPNAFIADIYRQLVRVAFVIFGIVVALDILNASALLSTILGAAGIIGLALGFAVRDTVENFIASVMLSFRQPFRPNDAIEINGDEGKVIRLTSRATILLSYDGNHIRIPNATVFKSRIVNYTRNDERRVMFEIGVASDCDLSAVRDLATQTVADLPFILERPAPLVWIDRIGDGAVFLTVTGWVDQEQTSPVRAKGEALRLVKTAIEAAGVEVPDTTYRIQMLGAGAASVTATEDRPEPKRPAPQDATVADVGTGADAELDKIIAEERSDGVSPDLLDESSPNE